jgi:hypothetical protein
MAVQRVVVAAVLLALFAAPAFAASTDKLIDVITKGKFDGFVSELQKESVDINTPDAKGRLPIIEAVKAKNLVMVDSLLQYGALVSAKEVSSGATALHYAISSNSVEIVHLLLQYGADPNVADKAGKKARDGSTNGSIQEYLRMWDEEGATAFEDAPGTWRKEKSEGGEEYWYNKAKEESRWNLPPSCAWQRVDVQNHPAEYTNSITGQKMHTIPKALAWRKVRLSGELVWFNWKINVTQYETPNEVPEYLLNEADKHLNARWYNEATGEFSWEDPMYLTSWRPVQDEQGRGTFYYNVLSGESQWEEPEELAWREVPDEENNRMFFHNTKTGESTWEKPARLSWQRRSDDL